MSARTAAASTVRPLVAYALAQGMAKAELFQRFDLDENELASLDGRIELPTLARMWEELPELLDQPDMALRTIEHAAWTAPPLAMLVFMSAATLRDGFDALIRYERLNYDLDDEPISRIVEEGDTATLMLDHERSVVPPPTAAVVDSLVGIVTLATHATGTTLVPRRVELRHARPERPALYHATFGCTVEFETARDRLVLDAADLDRPILGATATLAAIVREHADHKLAELQRGEDLDARLRDAIRLRLPHGKTTVSDLARDLGTSLRTLQRKLEARGLTARDLVDDERRALGVRLVGEHRHTLVEIALRLGFAEASAFTRAFVRWTGETPSAYRRKHRA